MHTGISFRPITEEDQQFLYEVYASTRAEEMSVTNFTEREKEDFLRFQHHAQHTDYMNKFRNNSDFLIILINNTPTGRLYLGRWRAEIRIIDIALLPEYRNRGIGAQLLHDIINEAASAGKLVTGHIEHYNRAINFYKRLGFKIVELRGIHYFIEWRPEKKGGDEAA